MLIRVKEYYREVALKNIMVGLWGLSGCRTTDAGGPSPAKFDPLGRF